MRNITLTTTVAVLAIASLRPQAQADAPDASGPYVSILKEHGIEATVESIGKYLHSLRPDGDRRKLVQTLIEQLGDNSFRRRETAMKELLRLMVAAQNLLNEAKKSDDPEIRWRAKHVLKLAESRGADTLYAALYVVRTRKLKGLARPVLAIVPFCRTNYMQLTVRGALRATVLTPDDEFLRSSLRSDDPQIRIAAIGALEQLFGGQASADLQPLLKDRDDHVRLAAAETLAIHSDRSVLPVLGKLLESADVSICNRSVVLLRNLTGQRFEYSAYDEDTRAKMAAPWLAWIRRQGKTAKLTFPARRSQILLGRTLICYYQQNLVIELDARGRETWKLQMKNPWGCQGLPNGHRLIASYSGRQIVEYDELGKEVWRKDKLPGSPFKVRRLENGNTLVACSDSGKVLEYAPDKQKVWEITLAGRPMDARRLRNGLTLVALQNANKVVEVDAEGKIVWEVDKMGNPLAVQRLDNGNTLVCQMRNGTVREIDRAGKSVWSTKEQLALPYDAQRLPNGNTLVVDRQGVHEFDPKGKFVWHKLGQNASGVCRY